MKIMRRGWIITLTIVLGAAMLLTSCKGNDGGKSGGAGKGVALTVVTSYGADDGNRQNYEAGIKAWQEATGNTVIDNSAMSNEAWKAEVNTDFVAGTEPDVLFYFTGVDADSMIKDGKVVSLADIQATYPDYGSNMNNTLLPKSTADGAQYVLPTTGFWEALYINKKVLADAGVAVPGKDYTWEQFLADCKTVKDRGYTPVAASLQEVPHYWWEFAVFNNDSLGSHLDIPKSTTDAAGKAWAAGLNDIKAMYEAGVFPKNTLTATDAGSFQLMADNKAAFAIDGSWKMGWFMENAADHLDDYVVTYVPGKGSRRATDIIGGISMGYYITKKAWDDPEKQKAAVDFITYMTSDAVLARFSNNGVAPTALTNVPSGGGEITPFVQSAIDMFQGQTGSVAAVQDQLTGAATTELFSGVKDVVSGSMKAEDLIAKILERNGE